MLGITPGSSAHSSKGGGFQVVVYSNEIQAEKLLPSHGFTSNKAGSAYVDPHVISVDLQ